MKTVSLRYQYGTMDYYQKFTKSNKTFKIN